MAAPRPALPRVRSSRATNRKMNVEATTEAPCDAGEEEGEEERGVLVSDCSPVFTLWRVDGVCTARLPRVVWIFQAEGGAVTQEVADAYFELLEGTVAKTAEDFVTFYDFTGSIKNFLPFAMQLASNAARIRKVMKPVRTVILCPNTTVRNIMRLIISAVGGDSPYVIVDSLDEGWQTAFGKREDCEAGVRDSYEGESLTAGINADEAARGLVTLSMGGVSQNSS